MPFTPYQPAKSFTPYTPPSAPTPVGGAQVIKNPFSTIGSQVAQQFGAGVDQTKKALGQVTSPNSSILQRGEGVLGAAAGAINTVSSPLAPVLTPLGSGVNSLVNKATNNKTFQKVASALPNLPYDRLSEDAGNIGTIAGAAAGAKGFSKLDSVVSKKMLPSSTTKIGERTLKDAIEITKPTLNKKATIQSLENVGKPGGVTTKGILKTAERTPDSHDIKVAQSVMGVVKKADPIENIGRINHEISNISEKEIKPFLDANPATFNSNQIGKHIDGVAAKMPKLFKSDATMQNTYRNVGEVMKEVIAESKHTSSGLWDALKTFDRKVEKEFPNLYEGNSNQVVKSAVSDYRRAIQNYIADNTPNGTVEFKQKIQRLGNMFDARHNIAEAHNDILKSHSISRLIKKYPKTATALGTIAGYQSSKLLGL